jgi:hypothetical protein
MDAAFHGGSNDIIGGRRYRPFIPFNFLLSLAAPHLHGVLVLVTGDKFIAGIIVTADNWSPMSTINLSLVSTTPAITENPWQGLIAGVVDTAEQLFAGVVTQVININTLIFPRIFEKIQNGPNGILGGLGDTDSWKKTEIENLVSDSL